MATMYGTIPTLSSDFQAGQTNRIRSSLARIRPWREMASSLSFPDSFNHALSRINSNAAYFRTNYVIIILFLLYLSLLWHPVLLIIFVATMFAWLFLYFLRDGPVFIFGYEVDESVVVTVLSILTVVLLVTHATVNVVMGILAGTAVLLLHGACRADDLIVDEDEGGGHSNKVDLVEAASSSFSSHA